MKAKVAIGPIRIEAELDTDKPEVQQECQRLIDNAAERLEAAMAQAVCEELKRLLPGITATCIGAWNEGEEEGPTHE